MDRQTIFRNKVRNSTQKPRPILRSRWPDRLTGTSLPLLVQERRRVRVLGHLLPRLVNAYPAADQRILRLLLAARWEIVIAIQLRFVDLYRVGGERSLLVRLERADA